MFDFYWKGDDYSVKFYYVNSVDIDNPFTEKVPVETGCTILKNDVIIANGIAMCNYPAEMPVKRVGRKIALSRALSGFDKEFRTLVWKLYLSKIKIK